MSKREPSRPYCAGDLKDLGTFKMVPRAPAEVRILIPFYLDFRWAKIALFGGLGLPNRSSKFRKAPKGSMRGSKSVSREAKFRVLAEVRFFGTLLFGFPPGSNLAR